MLVEIFYHIDEFCITFEKEINKKSLTEKEQIRDRPYRLSLSEIMTICVYYHYSGYKTFKDYYCKHVLRYMQIDFKGLVSYSRFIELKQMTSIPLVLFLKLHSADSCTGISFIDSFALKVCNNRRIYSHKVFKNIAERGHTSVGWFYGFKIHFVINHIGEIVDFYLSSGNIADNNIDILKALTSKLFGKLAGDKGYMVKPDIFEMLYEKGIHLITKLRKNMKNKLMPLYDKLILRKRGTIESSIGILKESFSIEHTRHRSPKNFLTHIFSALTAYFFKQYKPSILSSQQVLTQLA